MSLFALAPLALLGAPLVAGVRLANPPRQRQGRGQRPSQVRRPSLDGFSEHDSAELFARAQAKVIADEKAETRANASAWAAHADGADPQAAARDSGSLWGGDEGAVGSDDANGWGLESVEDFAKTHVSDVSKDLQEFDRKIAREAEARKARERKAAVWAGDSANTVDVPLAGIRWEVHGHTFRAG